MYRKDSGSASVKATDTLPDCGCAVRLRNVRMIERCIYRVEDDTGSETVQAFSFVALSSTPTLFPFADERSG